MGDTPKAEKLTMEQLRERYPRFKVKSEPLKDCPQCRGNGHYLSKARTLQICMCPVLTVEDELRRAVMESFKKAVKEMSRELKEGTLGPKFIDWVKKGGRR